MTPEQLREKDYTPKQCLLAAAAMEAGEPMDSIRAIELLRAHADALEENARLAARVAELEAALDRYGCHADSCGDMDAMNGAEIKSCNCGLDAARRTK